MRVVGTLTTMPHRYDKLLNTLRCLNNQTYKLDAIYLGLPVESRRLKVKYPLVSNEIKTLCTVVHLNKDYGPVSKILGGLLMEKDPETYIITFDDDVQYSSLLVEKLMLNSGRNAAIGSNGFSIGNGFPFYEAVINNNNDSQFLGFSVNRIFGSSTKEVDILCGFSGILYQRKFFADDFYHTINNSDENLFLNDDVLISGYLSKKEIKRYIASTPAPDIQRPPMETDDPTGPSGPNGQMKALKVAVGSNDTTAISYDKIKFLRRFRNAIDGGKNMGFFATTAPSSIVDSVIFQVIIILLFIIIFLFLFYKFMTTDLPEHW